MNDRIIGKQAHIRFPETGVPVYAVIRGVKVMMGIATIDVHTGVVSTELDMTSPDVQEIAKFLKDNEEYSIPVTVSELISDPRGMLSRGR